LAPRTILYTGKGGVGKTSVAAATARRCAASGLRTIVLSTDPAHSLGDSMGVELGPQPREIGERLWAQQVSAQVELENHWSAVRDWLHPILLSRGVDAISARELTVPPGLDELFSLLQIKHHHDEGRYDAVIVDCAPTGETLRLLSFPDVARWWIDKIFPKQGRIMEAARPFARAVLDLSLPDDAVIDDVTRLVANLIEMNEILRDHSSTSIRLVMNPDRMVIDEARRTFTYLNLYGYLTDAVIVNRVFPEQVGEYFAGWRARQQDHLVAVRDGFAPVPVLCAPFLAHEVIGPDALDELGDVLFDDRDPAAVMHTSVAQRLEVAENDATLRFELPGTTRDEVSLAQVGLELVVEVDGHRRTLLLPPAMADYRPAGATMRDGGLEVRFERTVAVGVGDA
jgi:arsenite/tail-anchored protein-transporting ATPase